RFRTSSPFMILNATATLALAQGQAVETYEVRLTTNNKYLTVTNASGTEIVRSTMTVLLRQLEPQSSTILKSINTAPGMTWGGMADKELRGD
ncbi:hypothetical protein, partial [Salmonella enterica]|uniref:hypothetical protein n=1 Tax=Salmonella enterica TaxID=28901 RepID=UPI0039E906DC